jgi:hypothetical protein
VQKLRLAAHVPKTIETAMSEAILTNADPAASENEHFQRHYHESSCSWSLMPDAEKRANAPLGQTEETK